MPQMAPLNWLSLMIYFIIVFLIVNSINYYSFLYTPKSYNSQIKKKKINWKW